MDRQRASLKPMNEEMRKVDELLAQVRNEVAVPQELLSSTIAEAVIGQNDVCHT